MATVKIVTPREQSSSFALYRTSAGGDESIIVRRKVGEPTDTNHTKSRKLKRQRDELALASHHYSQLTPSQKAITKHQIEEVEYIKSHGKTDTKLLKGRQLFISKEMHSLETTQKQLVLPYELCIMLVDELLLPIEGELFLRYLIDAEWKETGKEKLYTGSWLFSQTPRAQQAYRPYGEAEDYYDPELPEHQFMTEAEILSYRYHILHTTLVKICHSLPTGLTALGTTHSYRFANPFKPCNAFELKELLVSLRRLEDPSHPPLSTGFLAVHEATAGQKPIEPPLRKVSFNISVPAYPEWKMQKVTFEPLALEADKLYTWVVGFPYQTPLNGRIEAERGTNGDCNLDPIGQTYMSRWLDGYWQDWNVFAQMQYHYEMKATPP